MAIKSKAATFIGFAMKSGKYKIGLNAVNTLKKARLVIVCHTASENSKKEALKLAKRFNCKILETTVTPLEEFTHRENSKIMAISDGALAEAVVNNSENDFIEIG